MPRNRTLPLLLAATALGAGGPPAASAATLSRAPDGALEYVAAPGETNRVLIYDNDDGATMTFSDTQGQSMGQLPSGCTSFDGAISWNVQCAYAPVRVALGDGDDEFSISSAVKAAVTVDGGTGNDTLKGNEFAQSFDGGPGNDVLRGDEGDDTLRGGDGNDDLEGGAGSDLVDGGAGDDLVSGDGYEGQWPDVIDGGPGTDRIEMDFGDRSYNAVQPDVAITLGGGADDGRPGEGDDVRGVEKVAINVAGRYTGTDAPEVLEVHQVLGTVVLDGRGGDDRLIGADGPDHIDGGAGADAIDAGFGDDTISGGPGRDAISADRAGGDCGPLWCKYPYGNDTVDAVDGEVDSITCGAGEDTVRADPQDIVAADCEHVTRVGGVAPQGANGGSGGAGASQGTGAARLTVKRRASLQTALRRGIAMRITGLSPGRRITLTAKSGKRVVARGAGKIAASGNATITLRFSAAGRRLIAHRSRVRLTVSGGGTRTTITLKRTR